MAGKFCDSSVNRASGSAACMMRCVACSPMSFRSQTCGAGGSRAVHGRLTGGCSPAELQAPKEQRFACIGYISCCALSLGFGFKGLALALNPNPTTTFFAS